MILHFYKKMLLSRVKFFVGLLINISLSVLDAVTFIC